MESILRVDQAHWSRFLDRIYLVRSASAGSDGVNLYWVGSIYKTSRLSASRLDLVLQQRVPKSYSIYCKDSSSHLYILLSLSSVLDSYITFLGPCIARSIKKLAQFYGYT